MARPPTDPRGVAERYFACINADDHAGLREVLAPDVEIRPVGSAPLRGPDEAVAYYAGLLEGFAEHDDQPRRFLVSGDSVTVEIRFVGRRRSGEPVEFDAVDVFDTADGRVQRLSIWYDSLAVWRAAKRAQTQPGDRSAS